MPSARWLLSWRAFICQSSPRSWTECVEQMYLREKGSETNLGGVILEYDSAAGPTNFMVGTEQGHIFSCNRKAKNPADR